MQRRRRHFWHGQFLLQEPPIRFRRAGSDYLPNFASGPPSSLFPQAVLSCTPQQPPTMQEKKDGETRQLRRERRGEPVNGTDSSGLSRADVQSKLVARTRSNIEGGAEGRARRRCDSDGGRDWRLDTLEPLFPTSLGISDRTGRPGRPPPPRQRGRGPILACV